MLLNTLDELGDDDVAGVWQCAVLNEKASEADGSDYAVNRGEEFSGLQRFIEHLRY